MGDFDWWEENRLAKLVNALRDCEESCGRFGRRLDPPKVEDRVYWKTLADMCDITEDSDCDDDEEEAPEVTFAKDVHTECEASHDFTLINDKVAVGDLGAAESRLMLNLRGVRSILYAASHEMESLWEKDGIRYHTLIVSSSNDPSTSLASSLGAACTFLSKNKPALICSSCPKLRATIAAALLHFESPIEMPVAAAIDHLTELAVLNETDILGVAEQHALIEFSSADFSAMGYGSMSPHMVPRVPESPTVTTELFGVNLPTPGSSGKRQAPFIEEENDAKAFKLNPSDESPKLNPSDESPAAKVLSTRMKHHPSDEIAAGSRMKHHPSDEIAAGSRMKHHPSDEIAAGSRMKHHPSDEIAAITRMSARRIASLGKVSAARQLSEETL